MSDAQNRDSDRTNDSVVFTRVVGIALVLILIFGVLNTVGVIHVG